MTKRTLVCGAAEGWIIAACMKQLETTGRPCLDPAFLGSPSPDRPSDADLVRAYDALQAKEWARGHVVRSHNAESVLHSVCLTQRAVEFIEERG